MFIRLHLVNKRSRIVPNFVHSFNHFIVISFEALFLQNLACLATFKMFSALAMNVLVGHTNHDLVRCIVFPVATDV